MPTRSPSCELHARLLLDVQAALMLTTETVLLESIDSHFQRNVRGAPCNTSLTVLPLPGVYRDAYPSIVSVNAAVMISGGHPCRASCPDSAGSNLPPNILQQSHATAVRHSAGFDAKVVYSIDGWCCFTQYFWHPPCRDRTSVGDACTGAQFTTIFPAPVLNAVRAYIHCNHLQSAPTTRDSAPGLGSNAHWRRQSSLESHVPFRLDLTRPPIRTS